MIGSINGLEFVVLIVVVLLVIGPERLPTYAAQLGRLVREFRTIARGATERVKEELGPEFEELRDLDPRQYDPRRIIRDALADDPVQPVMPPRDPSPSARAAGGSAAAGAARFTRPAPFDDEAT